MQAENTPQFDVGREVRLMREGAGVLPFEVETVNLDTPEEIADHFGIPERVGAVAQICRRADEQDCVQGMALDDVAGIVVEPRHG